jgi:hypothetical protein
MVTNPEELVTSREGFSLLSEECTRIIDTRKRLPDFVFRRHFAKYFAIEYAYVGRQEFANFLVNMSGLFRDESVNYMTLVPDPVDYYYRNFSFFGVASFKPSNLVERYFRVMSRDKNIDSFLMRGGDVGVFWGSSLEWGVFSDRISWEMAVIAVPESVDVPMVSGFRCMDASWLTAYVAKQYQVKDPSGSIAPNFVKRFLTNYPIAGEAGRPNLTPGTRCPP